MSDKIRNPKTGRMVKKTGKIGLEIIKNKIIKKILKGGNKYQQLLSSYSKIFQENLDLKEKINLKKGRAFPGLLFVTDKNQVFYMLLTSALG